MDSDNIFGDFSGFLEQFGQNSTYKGILIVDGETVEFSKDEVNNLLDYLREDIEEILNFTAKQVAKSINIPFSEQDEPSRIKSLQMQLGLAWFIGRKASLKKIYNYLEN